jgi:hypothetical protein
MVVGDSSLALGMTSGIWVTAMPPYDIVIPSVSEGSPRGWNNDL